MPFNYYTLPNFSCQYCGIHDPKCVVQCTHPHCFRWFCNTKYPNEKRSHYLVHSLRSRHHSVRNYNGLNLQCKCGVMNIYKLKMNENARISCYNCIFKKKLDFNRKKWSPFIREHRLPCIWIDVPMKSDYQKMIILKPSQIKKLENMWKKGFYGRFEELQHFDESDERMRAHKNKDIYNSPEEYVEIMFGLLDLHEQDDKDRTQDYYQNNVSLKWLNEVHFRLIDCSNYDYFSGYLKVGSFLQVSFHQNDEYVDVLIEFIDNSKNIIECSLLTGKNSSHANKLRDKVDVKSLWIDIPYKRMAEAIIEIKDNSFFLSKLSSYFWRGEPEDPLYPSVNHYQRNGLNELDEPINLTNTKLNNSQKVAITKALNSEPLTLIQGPPGTGKTTTLFEIIAKINEDNLANRRNLKKVLYCAPSNIAVDNIAIKLVENKIETVRMYSVLREKCDEFEEKLDTVALHRLVFKKTGLKRSEFLSHEDFRRYKDAENKILRNFEIIGCTCSSAGDPRIKNINFDYVIIDEAAQALEMETLIPIVRCTKKLILCGDHKQLGPVVFSSLGKSLGLGISLFERLAKQIQPYLLETQYRMHKKIAEYPSLTFYEGRIRTGVNRNINNQLSIWPNQKAPLLFCHIKGKEEIGPNGNSFLNRDEAYFIKSAVKKLISKKIDPKNIGIITPYLGQKFYLLNEEGINENVHIASVDGFQGKEQDYILISCVRSNLELGVGFLNEINRINVAITRAKYGMIICGNMDTLKRNEEWKKLLDFYKKKGMLMKGEDINHMKKI